MTSQRIISATPIGSFALRAAVAAAGQRESRSLAERSGCWRFRVGRIDSERSYEPLGVSRAVIGAGGGGAALAAKR